MSNATILQNHNEIIGNNNNSIDELIESINNLPEAGSGEIEITLQEKTITPSTSQQNVVADSNYTGLSKVVVNAVTSAIDSDIKATNIRKGVNILGVTGTVEEGITPTGTLNITTNGTHNVTNYASASVNVPSEDLTSELNTYETYLDTQEATIEDIMAALEGKGTGGGITPEGTLNITENGSYDVTNYANAEVNVASSGGDEIASSILSRSITSFTDNEITNIGNYAFHSCTALTSVVANNLRTMGTYVFYGCTKLTSFIAPLLQDVSVFVFYNSGLTSLTLPSAKSMGMHAVRSCKSLTRVDLGACTSLATTAFEGDTLLTTFILRTSSVCAMANVNVFQNTPIESGTGYVYVPDNLVSSYKTATNWSTYASQIKGISELGG